MPHNEGSVDRAVRGIAAVLLAVVGLFLGAGSIPGIVTLAVAAILAVTAAVGFCPLYRLVGASTVRAGRTAAR